MIRRLTQREHLQEEGQALVEFALTLPILLFVVFGILDFGRILFTYAQASNSLREALHYAQLTSGFGDNTYVPYLDCATMTDLADDSFFANSQSVTITYIKASNMATTYPCPADVNNIDTGDMLRIRVVAGVDPIMLPFGSMNLTFEGQRSIVRAVPIKIDMGGGGGGGMYDPDGDGIDSASDNCPTVANADQADLELDGVGDACDNCPNVTNTDQADTDGNGIGNACDAGSGVPPAPPAPLNFVAVSDPVVGGNGECTTGQVDFFWTAMNPVPERMEIRDATTNLVAVNVDDVPTGLITEAYCYDCDTIDNYTGYQCYYIVAYNGIAPNESQSPPSNDFCVSCRWTMPAPVNFDATADCDTGRVSFDWDWGVAAPLPSRAELRDATTGAVVVNMTGSLESALCPDCDTISMPGTRSYVVVAYNGTVPTEVSNSDSVSCPAPPARVGGDLRLKNNSGNCNGYSTSYIVSSGLTLQRIDTTPAGPILSPTWNGYLFEFKGLAGGEYRITVPTVVAGNGLLSRETLAQGCQDMSTSTYTFTLAEHEQKLDLRFGYR